MIVKDCGSWFQLRCGYCGAVEVYNLRDWLDTSKKELMEKKVCNKCGLVDNGKEFDMGEVVI